MKTTDLLTFTFFLFPLIKSYSTDATFFENVYNFWNGGSMDKIDEKIVSLITILLESEEPYDYEEDCDYEIDEENNLEINTTNKDKNYDSKKNDSEQKAAGHHEAVSKVKEGNEITLPTVKPHQPNGFITKSDVHTSTTKADKLSNEEDHVGQTTEKIADIVDDDNKESGDDNEYIASGDENEMPNESNDQNNQEEEEDEDDDGNVSVKKWS